MRDGVQPARASLFTVPVEFFRPIPSVAMIPLAVIVWGAGFHHCNLPPRLDGDFVRAGGAVRPSRRR
jgi:hypothetical protein